MITTELSGTALLQLLIANRCSIEELADRLFAAMRIGEKETKHLALGFSNIEGSDSVIQTEFFNNVLEDYKKNGVHLELYFKDGDSCVYYYLNPTNFQVTVIIIAVNTSKYQLEKDPKIRLSIIDTSKAFEMVRDNALSYLDNTKETPNE